MTPAPTTASRDRSERAGRPRPRLVPAAVVAVAGLLLSACGDGVDPGVAAEVDDVRISVDEVDDLATMICQIDVGSGQGGTPKSEQRSTALTVLLSIALGREIGDVEDVPQEQVTQSLQAASQARALVSEDLKDYFDEIVSESTRAAAALDAVAVQNLLERGEQPSQETVPPEVAQIQADYLEDHPVELDPRFGEFEDGQIVSDGGSISVPASQTALGLAPQQPEAGQEAPQPADPPAAHVCS